MNFHHIDMALIAAVLVGVVLPGISSLVNVWHSNVAGFITLLLSAASGFFGEWAKAGTGYDWKQAAGVALLAYATACLARLQLWAGTRADANLQAVGTKPGA